MPRGGSIRVLPRCARPAPSARGHFLPPPNLPERGISRHGPINAQGGGRPWQWAGPGLLPAGGGEDGRFPEGAPGVQQEQLQQVPCGFRLQGLQPPALGVFAHQRIPLGADHRDREDKHPPALPPPAVGQKECGQEAGAGAGGAGGGELGPSAEDRPDRQPGHDRGHLNPPRAHGSEKPGIREFPKLFPLLFPPFFFFVGGFFFVALEGPSGNSWDLPYLFGIRLFPGWVGLFFFGGGEGFGIYGTRREFFYGEGEVWAWSSFLKFPGLVCWVFFPGIFQNSLFSHPKKKKTNQPLFFFSGIFFSPSQKFPGFFFLFFFPGICC